MAAIASSSPSQAFLKMIRNPLAFRFFLFRNLPVALFSGVKLQSVNEAQAEVSVPYKWLTRNPFRSTYFASLSMAAEMSTGILAMQHLYQRKSAIALLVTSIEGTFMKKAVERTLFRCVDGIEILHAIEAAAAGTPAIVKAKSTGFNPKGEIVAEFYVTWSFKKRAS